jgi:hypothetical protein
VHDSYVFADTPTLLRATLLRRGRRDASDYVARAARACIGARARTGWHRLMVVVPGARIVFERFDILRAAIIIQLDVTARASIARAQQSMSAEKEEAPRLRGADVLPAATTSGARFTGYYDRILAHSGHRIRSIGANRSVTYECGTCGVERSSYLGNMVKSSASSYCLSCQNANKTKRGVDDVRARLDAAGMSDYRLVAYIDNKHVQLVCPSGHAFETAMNALVERGRRCPQCAPIRRAETNVAKYGCANAAAAPAIKRKIEETLEKNNGGGHHHMKRPARERPERRSRGGHRAAGRRDVVACVAAATPLQRDETMMATHDGLEYAFRSDEALANGRAACGLKYGAKFPVQSAIVRETMKANSRENFGCDHPMQNVAEFSRRQYMLKDYTFPSGRGVEVRGYEPQFIDELLKTHSEDEIVVDQCLIPSIRYMRPMEPGAGYRATCAAVGAREATTSLSCGVERQSVYHPDMRVGQRLYEVKCRYTFECEKIRNLAKFQACADQGYELDVVVFNNGGTRIEETLEYRPRADADRPVFATDDAGSPIAHTISDAYDRRRLEDQRRMVSERSGHSLLSINGKIATFVCGACGEQGAKPLIALARSEAPRTCPGCSNRTARKTVESAQAELVAKGIHVFTVLRYDNERSVFVRCCNGHEQTAKFANLVRAGKCPRCF